MKIKNLFYLLLALPLAFAACNETPDVPPTPEAKPSLTLTSDAVLNFGAEGGEAEITYTLENAVEGVELQATADVDWITINSAADGVVAFTVAKNETNSQRGGNITLTYGEVSATATIEQYQEGYDPNMNYTVFSVIETWADSKNGGKQWNVTFVEKVELALPRKEISVSCVTAGHYAVKEVNASVDRFENIDGSTDTHQIPGLVHGHVGFNRLDDVIHFFSRFSNRKTTDLAWDRAAHSALQPGSSIKPLTVYAPALDAGLITYGTIVDDTPFMFNEKTNSQGDIKYTAYPANLPAVYKGLTTINSAVERSVNTIAMKVN